MAAVVEPPPASGAAPKPPHPGHPGRWGAWWLALRPRTLSAGAVPVAVGTAVALAQGQARPLAALAALLGALCLQVASNLVNDAEDFERGADHEGRLGPARAAASGWLRPAELRRGALLALGVAALVGLYLIALGGLWIALGGGLALVAAWAYTGGPAPLGYRGWGDAMVFVFFGLFAVVGTHRVQAELFSLGAVLSAVPIGLLATAILAVNNLRDRAGDAAAGKRTVAVRLGPGRARAYTAGLVLAAYASLAPLSLVAGPAAALLPLSSLPLAWRWLAAVQTRSGAELNPVLGATAQLQVAFGLALAVGWLL